MKGLDAKTMGSLVRLLIFILVTTLATGVLVVTIGNLSFGGTKQYRAEFVDATGHVTEAERFGWSFVFAGLLPPDFPPTRGVAHATRAAKRRNRAGRARQTVRTVRLPAWRTTLSARFGWRDRHPGRRAPR